MTKSLTSLIGKKFALKKIKRWLGCLNFNRVILSKWLLRFANERGSLWRKVISLKFGEERGEWCSCKGKSSFGIGAWKEIRKGWETFLPNTIFSLGDGRRVHFWKDIWCMEEPLSIIFPALFALVVNKMLWWQIFGRL